jgi:hypothetical protein
MVCFFGLVGGTIMVMLVQKLKDPINLLVLLGGFGAVLVIGYLAYTPYAAAKERRQYDQAAQKLEELIPQIESLAGKADAIERTKTCDRPNLKYAKGPLNCSVGIYLLYTNSDARTSSEKKDSVSGISSLPIRSTSIDTSDTNFVPKDSVRAQQVFFQDLFSAFGLKCTTSYRYPATDRSKEFGARTDESMDITVNCGGPAKAEHFPIEN